MKVLVWAPAGVLLLISAISCLPAEEDKYLQRGKRGDVDVELVGDIDTSFLDDDKALYNNGPVPVPSLYKDESFLNFPSSNENLNNAQPIPEPYAQKSFGLLAPSDKRYQPEPNSEKKLSGFLMSDGVKINPKSQRARPAVSGDENIVPTSDMPPLELYDDKKLSVFLMPGDIVPKSKRARPAVSGDENIVPNTDMPPLELYDEKKLSGFLMPGDIVPKSKRAKPAVSGDENSVPTTDMPPLELYDDKKLSGFLMPGDIVPKSKRARRSVSGDENSVPTTDVPPLELYDDEKVFGDESGPLPSLYKDESFLSFPNKLGNAPDDFPLPEPYNGPDDFPLPEPYNGPDDFPLPEPYNGPDDFPQPEPFNKANAQPELFALPKALRRSAIMTWRAGQKAKKHVRKVVN